MVRLSANGRERAEVAVGKPVTFVADIQAPPNGGAVVAAEWDFEGRGNYPVNEPVSDFKPGVSLIRRRHILFLSPASTSPCSAPPHNEKAIRRHLMPAFRT